ncbi:sugar O-acetyltransferase [Nocardioides sp. NPDC092400]|uniref:sugar O-acetyltransferase n=2 Tax=unclassified Nocardioides TaxID=2615069 RepID=UPI0034442D89
MSDERPDDTRTMRERMLAGDLYIADDPDIEEESAAARDLMAAYNATTARQKPLRRAILEQLLGSVGEGTELRQPVYVDFGTNISIGARCFANFGLVALDVAPITIGDDVQIGPNVQLLTPTHPVEPGPRRDKWEAAEPITIGDNVWLGGGAIVLPGVTIGANTVVGAGSVVTKDLPADVVAVGNPARVVKHLTDDWSGPGPGRSGPGRVLRSGSGRTNGEGEPLAMSKV